MAKRVLNTDIESYWNYFLVALEDDVTGEQFEYSMFGEDAVLSKADRQNLRRVITKHKIITFNGNGYDMLVLTAAIKGFCASDLKRITNAIIADKMKPWEIEREYGFVVPEIDHIDLMEVAPGKASLKIYHGRNHGRRLQDLPYHEDTTLTRAQADKVCDYCFNDLDATKGLYKTLSGQINLRIALSREHGIDLRSKSDAQVAEAIIKKEIKRITGKCEKPDLKKWGTGTRFHYRAPAYIKFRSRRLKDLLMQIETTPFRIGKNGYVDLPEEIKEEKIRINRGLYTLGIGGLHSNEKSTTHVSDEEFVLRDSDVTSYYPMIIIGQGLYPAQLGPAFKKVFRRIVEDRIHAKQMVAKLEEELPKINDPDRIAQTQLEISRWQIAADGGKIMVNGSFGKFGSSFSILYSPPLLIQTTITGQLSLLMLIERLEDIGIEVVSANTDGIVSKIPRWMEDEYKAVLEQWQSDTGFGMEFTDYRGLYSRDVNSYIAITTKGKAKTKGAFSLGSLMNNPSCEISIQAVIDYLKDGKPIGETIKSCNDIRKFITIRTVNGGAVWPVKRFSGGTVANISKVRDGEFLGKSIRWYYGKDVDWAIHYNKPTQSGNHNKVPKTLGAVPIMEFQDTPSSELKFDDRGKPINPYVMPTDVDRAFYMREAYQILEDVGYESNPYGKLRKK